MDRLRSPGGCPWDAEQTHESLARYLLEETYEVLEAIETRRPRRCCARSSATCCCRCSSTPGSREEERRAVLDRGRRRRSRRQAGPPASARLRRRRHAPTPATLNETWERSEDRREGTHVGRRRGAAGAAGAGAGGQAGRSRATGPGSTSRPQVRRTRSATRLFAVVRDAVAAGVDPETALRRTARAYRDAIVAAEVASPELRWSSRSRRAATCRVTAAGSPSR